MTDPDNGDMMRCGFVAIIGAPNAGKSTLLNRLAGSKLAIVSAKVQTTRTRTLGIVIEGRSQIVRSEEHTSELQSLMRNSYAVFCLKKKKNLNHTITTLNKLAFIFCLNH